MADPNDPLDKASEALFRLKDADDWDEPTGQTNINITVPTNPTIKDKPSDPPASDKVTAVTKNVSTLTKLLPPEHRVYFLGLVVVVGALLFAAAKGWI